MVVAHVGATLLAYAVLLVATGDADGSHNRTFDYGTSAVWLGLLGALTVDWVRRGRRLPAAAASATAVAGAVLFPLMPALEHAFAFALGAALAALRESRRPVDRSARSGASTESAPAAVA
jgi:peptidoglycan/LPS O-acetylase OafA/YrhL